MKRIVSRSGKVKPGVVLAIVVVVAAVFLGTQFGGPYWRRYRFADAVTQQLGFAGQRSDDGIRQGILAEVDDLGLPAEARRFRLVRTEQPRRLVFSVSYTETIDLLVTTTQISFSVRKTRRF